MTPPFIHISLCDNDFAQELEAAARLLHERLPDCVSNLDVARITEAVIGIMCSLAAIRYLSSPAEFVSGTEQYLRKELRVHFAMHPPTADHDGGSVAIDRNTGYVWRY